MRQDTLDAMGNYLIALGLACVGILAVGGTAWVLTHIARFILAGGC